MEGFKFNKQLSIELYRKWFLVEKRSRAAAYDKQQVSDLYNLIVKQTKSLIDYYCSNELVLLKDEFPVIQEKAFYRCKFPVLYIDYNIFKKVTLDLLVLDNTIECLNLPGCIVESDNLKSAFEKLIVAAIECFDVRFKKNMYLTNRVFPMKTYWNFSDLSSEEYIKELENCGWIEKYQYPFNTILLNENNEVTYTIANNSIVSGNLRFAFKRYQFLVSASMHRLMSM
jgi:hypothetical protein